MSDLKLILDVLVKFGEEALIYGAPLLLVFLFCWITFGKRS